MGQYVNRTSKSNGSIGVSFKEKCDALINDGATKIAEPTVFTENLVCVVNNGSFAAAAYAFDEKEMNVFLIPDERPKKWFVYDKVKQFAQ